MSTLIERLKAAARERVDGLAHNGCNLYIAGRYDEALWFLRLIEEADAAPAVVAESTPNPDIEQLVSELERARKALIELREATRNYDAETTLNSLVFKKCAEGLGS